jgi:hypothetical protein
VLFGIAVLLNLCPGRKGLGEVASVERQKPSLEFLNRATNHGIARDWPKRVPKSLLVVSCTLAVTICDEDEQVDHWAFRQDSGALSHEIIDSSCSWIREHIDAALAAQAGEDGTNDRLGDVAIMQRVFADDQCLHSLLRLIQPPGVHQVREVAVS